ncbi:MAG TPA: type ISP restriction/modification enzyme [Sphingomonas sp.]
MPATLDKITDFPALVDYLRDELEWPIAADIGLDEATYDVTPEEIGLRSSVVGGGIEIKQLRPLNRVQPWGVFFLNLPSAKLPVTLVRNILGKLAIKKRASANKSEQAAFAKHDLLFIAATGSTPDRRLAFAHFADDDVKGDAATLKVLGWDADDTPRRLGLTEASLRTKLHWPDDPVDVDQWRKQWGEAFAHADTPTVVRESKQMAKELAALARRIRDRAKDLIAAQTANGSLVKLHKAFKEALIHDLTPEGFADTYAQTIAYGLLSTAISRASGALTQDDMAANVAGTSPFLKEMLGTFIEAGGRKSGKAQGLDFDELGITDVVELLRNADMEAVLADFDRKNPDEDPVIHFYELFLKQYDAAQKVKRGVFYTPRPVVGFIVRSVDEVLRTEFGLEDGLASTATWEEVIAASKGKEGAEIVLPKGAKDSDPFVRILDPATGTGTFLVECIDLIHTTMVKKWKAAGKRDGEVGALWNAYVPAHLLPRLTGFELMMAPYAIAHVKLGLKLADTGYAFRSNEPARIYLTNALEPAQDTDMQLAFMSEALAHEARAANKAKETSFTVVVGNPPYKGESANPSKDAKGKLTAAGKLIQHFFLVDGKPLGERNAKWVNNDYSKFYAYSERILKTAGTGVIGFITSNSWLDSPTFRGVRASLLDTFSQMWIIDCHGNVSKSEKAPDGTPDKGVFEIEEGTNITVGMHATKRRIVYQHDLLGKSADKYAWLNKHSALSGAKVALAASPPLRQLVPVDATNVAEFDAFPSLEFAMPLRSVGMATARDNLTLHFSYLELVDTTNKFLSLDPEDARAHFVLGKDARDWKVKLAQQDLRSASIDKLAERVLYRPMDERWTAYSGKTKGFICMPRGEFMSHMRSMPNVGLITSRLTKGERFAHAAATDKVTEVICLSPKTSNNGFLFPLWLKPQGTETRTLPNIAPAFAASVAALTGLTYDDCIEGSKQGALGGILPERAEQTAMFAPARRERGKSGESFGPRDLFDYIFAVLHSPAYRARYADYLRSDFARIPLPGSRAVFEALVPLGTELVALHLLDAESLPILKDPKGVRLAGSGEARVAYKPEYDAKLGRVTINATRWFESIPQVTWDFHVGGYQPAQKWLKDRAARGGKKASDGRVLTDEDILHYRRMIVALTRTSELMQQVDAVVEDYGGWPGAFVAASSPAPAQLPALAAVPDGSWTWLPSIQPRDRLRYAAQYALWQMDPGHDASRIRFVIASLAEPALLTPLLSDDDRAAWLRLIGPDAQPSVGVVRLRPEINGAWRAMFETMITSGQLTEQSDGSWSRGQYFSDSGLDAFSIDAQRTAFAIRAVETIEVSNLKIAVAAEDNVVWASFGIG